MNKLLEIDTRDVELVIFTNVKKLWGQDEPITSFDERYPNRLESTLGQVFQAVFGQELYPDIYSKAAALFYFMIKNHPFINGNKRMAVMATYYFLYINGYWLYMFDDDDGLRGLALTVSNSAAEEKDKVLEDLIWLFKDRRAIRGIDTLLKSLDQRTATSPIPESV